MDKDTFNCKCKIITQVFPKRGQQTGNFYIFGCSPLDGAPVRLNSFNNFTITGDLGMLTVGQEYTLELKEVESKYGKQYQVVSIPTFDKFNLEDADKIDDETEYSLLLNMMSKTQAKNVHKAYPNFIRKVLSGDTEDIDYKNIENVAEIRLKSYMSKVNSLFKYFKLMNDNKDLEITYDDARKICENYANIKDAQKAINENPYMVMCTILSKSFTKVDSLILKKRPQFKDSDVRCLYLMIHLLKQNELDGNTRIYGNALAQYVNDWDSCLLQYMKQVALDSQKIYYDEKTKDISLMSTYLDEAYIANDLLGRLEHNEKWDIDYTKYQHGEYDLTDEQMDILRLVCEKNVAILVGNAGSGKTSSVQSLITMLEDNGISYRLFAPTGIASKRLHETTHRPASTIHKAVYSASEIDSDVVIIDEFSMCAVDIASALLHLVDDDSKVIMVCDNEQLASISCGNVLQDLLDSKLIPTATLTKVFRYGTTGLATVATDIRNGEDYLSKSIDQFNDYKFLTIEKNPLEQIMAEYAKLLKKYSYKDILILSPFNVGSFGTYAINARVQSEINPPLPNERTVSRKVSGAPNGEIMFRKGDKVINKKNNYTATTLDIMDYTKKLSEMEAQLEEIADFDGETSDEYYAYYDKIEEFKANEPVPTTLANGEIGYVLDIDDDNNMYVQFDEDIIIYTKYELSTQNVLLAYAISIHGVQGAQSKAVMVVTHPQHQKMLTKNLLYVADTRAQEYLVEIGDQDTIRKALRISETRNRKTWLYDLLKEYYEKEHN